MKKKKRGKVINKKSILNKNLIRIPIRYLILLTLMFTLPVIYAIFTPLTVKPTAFLLDLFYNIILDNNIILIDFRTTIKIIPACVAGSAYLLLLILNLTVPMEIKKRIKTILLSFLILLILNIARIFFLAIWYHESIPFFDFTHKLFWYGLSTLFVVAIWFFIAKKFSIKQIPVYSDMKGLTRGMKK